MVHHKMNRDSENTDVSRAGVLRFIHVFSTGWFVLCVCFLIVTGLRQAGVHWWVIFSLSGYSVVLVFLLISIYLFAVFRGVVRSQKTDIEHPLSNSIYYLVFYDVSPFLGMLAGLACVFDESSTAHHLNTIAFGSLATTFLVWIIVDPAIGLFEMLLPASREHRTQRLAEARVLRQRRRIESEQLLAELQHAVELNQQKWSGLIEPMAEKLAELIASFQPGSKYTEGHIVQIGADECAECGQQSLTDIFPIFAFCECRVLRQAFETLRNRFSHRFRWHAQTRVVEVAVPRFENEV